MNFARLTIELERFPAILRALVSGLSEEEVRFRPAEGVWSILEIVSHLADEEVEDFRARVESTLRDPDEDWNPIDPAAWVKERKYQEGDCTAALARFETERAKSVAFLRGLEAPPWSSAKVHPILGTLHAGDVFVSWVVHDQLHLRQITARLREIALRLGGGYSSRYAEP